MQRQLTRIVWDHVYPRHPNLPSVRRPDGLLFGSERDPRLWVYRAGTIVLRRPAAPPVGPTATETPLSFNELFADILGVLEMANAAYPTLASYRGRLYVGASLLNIYGRPIGLRMGGGDVLRDRQLSVGAEPIPSWFEDSEDEEPYRIGDDPLARTGSLMKSLLWHAGYVDYEPLVDRYVSDVRSGR